MFSIDAERSMTERGLWSATVDEASSYEVHLIAIGKMGAFPLEV
jgi:hypothetical protein